jgi:hypothetical protein
MAKIRTQTGSFAYAKYQLTRSILENTLKNEYNSDEYESALKYFGGCAYCGSKQTPRKDHLVPVVKCGDFVSQNIVPACQPCDDSKGQDDYQKWMRNGSSRCSLKARGFTNTQIEERIKLIEEWQSGYKSRTIEELFGEYFLEYKELLQRMDRICEEARQLSAKVKAENNGTTLKKVDNDACVKASKNADEIRAFLINKYIIPARNLGKKAITLRSGDIHDQLTLPNRYPNVCQVMSGDKLLTQANIKLQLRTGPEQGVNVYYTYIIEQ